MNKVGNYIEEETTFWQKVGMFCTVVAFIGVFWFCAAVGSAYQEHQLCMNGAVEHCIPEDFE